MKKFKSIIGVIACVSMIASTVPSVVSAEGEDLIYGTMNIPYSDFYKSELAGSSNEYEVDAVSSATTAKWCKNGEGELFEGTYNQANEDGTGTILGVTYPVALTSETLAELGDNNYSFIETTKVPTAYKTVTIENGLVTFSKVSGEATSFNAETSISTNTPWGDYLVDVTSTPEDIGIIYGVILNTSSNESYGLRHLENIWRGEFAWSVGFTTQEPHGNTLTYENYQGLMGDTITNITYITENGYYTVDTSLYVPVKFDGSIEVANASINDSSTTISTIGIPSDYNITYSIDGLNAQFNGDTITFDSAIPSSYTLSMYDANGVYMDMSTTFEITTDITPVQFDGTKLIKTADASDDDFTNYINNIQSVTVNDVSYNASGRKSIQIINEDGTIDTSVTSGQTAIFDGADSYKISVKSAGYSENLEFTLTTESATTTTTTTTSTTDKVTEKTTSESKSSSTTTNQNSSSSPATSDKGLALPISMLAVASVFMATIKKKHKD